MIECYLCKSNKMLVEVIESYTIDYERNYKPNKEHYCIKCLIKKAINGGF